MARKKSPTLTEAELRLMRVLWRRGEASASEIVRLIGRPPLARSTVMTTLGILERKGYVKHRTSERTYVFSATVQNDDAQRAAIKSLLTRFFDNSVRSLMVSVINDAELTPSELAEIRALLK